MRRCCRGARRGAAAHAPRQVLEFRLDLRGDFALYEAYLKDNKLRAQRPGDLVFPELTMRLLELRTGLVRACARACSTPRARC